MDTYSYFIENPQKLVKNLTRCTQQTVEIRNLILKFYHCPGPLIKLDFNKGAYMLRMSSRIKNFNMQPIHYLLAQFIVQFSYTYIFSFGSKAEFKGKLWSKQKFSSNERA